jgi:hypothetical protein
MDQNQGEGSMTGIYLIQGEEIDGEKLEGHPALGATQQAAAAASVFSVQIWPRPARITKNIGSAGAG